MVETFPVQLVFKGANVALPVTVETTGNQLLSLAQTALQVSSETCFKLLYKGKQLVGDIPLFPVEPIKTPKIMVLATQSTEVFELNSKRSDPTIRGFDNEMKVTYHKNQTWGEYTKQDKVYKFARFEACTWHSFGHRPTESTPHAFKAMELLETLATDPGIVAIMKERELFVNTLGEMDPIDDCLKQKKQSHGACLLGYNTNSGLRIDIKLRTDDLKGFRPYAELVGTLIHELSHNWVGDHNLLFWTNHGQMRIEYFHQHATLAASGYIVKGKTTAEIADISCMTMDEIFNQVMKELQQEMAQHGLQPSMIAAQIQQRCQELTMLEAPGRSLGGAGGGGTSARDLASAAAERRARQQKKDAQQ
jgi:hypothetical protein